MARGGGQNVGMPTAPTRQDQWFVIANLTYPQKAGGPDGKPVTYLLGAFDKKSGGEIDSDDNKYYPGANVVTGPISIGGRVTTGNLTLQRIWDQDNDEYLIRPLVAAVGKGAMTVVIQSKDSNGANMGKKITYTGTLKRVSLPDFDSESGTAALMELEMIVAAKPSVPAQK